MLQTDNYRAIPGKKEYFSGDISKAINLINEYAVRLDFNEFE